MAGDWIKVEHTLPTKPEVSTIADILGISEDEVVGKLVRLWIWADQHSADGHAVSVTQTTLDRRASCTGLADALRRVGWLEGRDAALSFPNFDRHNGQSAKRRTQATGRKKNAREKEKNMSRSERDENATREEKRREENKIEPAAPKPRKQPEGDHPEFIRRWVEEYPNHHGGEAYALCGPKDGALVSTLLKSCKKTPEEWQRIFVAAWKHPELFNCKAAASIGGFVSRFNEIRDELNALNKGAKVAVSALPSSEDLYATGQ